MLVRSSAPRCHSIARGRKADLVNPPKPENAAAEQLVVQSEALPEISREITTFEANISLIPLFSTTRRGLIHANKHHFVGEMAIGGVRANVELLISTDPTYGNYPSNFDRKVARAIDKLLWNQFQRDPDFANPLAFSSRELSRTTMPSSCRGTPSSERR